MGLGSIKESIIVKLTNVFQIMNSFLISYFFTVIKYLHEWLRKWSIIPTKYN